MNVVNLFLKNNMDAGKYGDENSDNWAISIIYNQTLRFQTINVRRYD